MAGQRQPARPASTAKGPAQVLEQSRQQLAQARDLGMFEECIRVLECKGGGRDETWSAQGQSGVQSPANPPSHPNRTDSSARNAEREPARRRVGELL